MNPYEVLGLPRDADKRAIRAAYRKLAKEHHPDNGGDPKRFGLLKLAHDILVDPARRAKFDATGDASETTADNSMSSVLAHLSVALQTVVAQNAVVLRSTDIISAMRVNLDANAHTVTNELAQIRSTIEKWHDVAARIRVKKGKPNLLGDICRITIATLTERIGEHERRLENIRKALKLLSDFSFECERAERSMKIPLDMIDANFLNAAARWKRAGL